MISQRSRKGPENDHKGSTNHQNGSLKEACGTKMSPTWHPNGGARTRMATKMVPRGPLRPHWGAKVPKLPKRGEVRDSILEHFGTKMAPKCIKNTCFKNINMLIRFYHFGVQFWPLKMKQKCDPNSIKIQHQNMSEF